MNERENARNVPYGDYIDLRRSLDRVMEQRDKLDELRPYVQHLPTCVLSYSRSPLRATDWCTCGLTAARASVRPKETR